MHPLTTSATLSGARTCSIKHERPAALRVSDYESSECCRPIRAACRQTMSCLEKRRRRANFKAQVPITSRIGRTGLSPPRAATTLSRCWRETIALCPLHKRRCISPYASTAGRWGFTSATSFSVSMTVLCPCSICSSASLAATAASVRLVPAPEWHGAVSVPWLFWHDANENAVGRVNDIAQAVRNC